MLTMIFALLQTPYRSILFFIWDTPHDAESIRKHTAISPSLFFDNMAYLVKNELIIYDSKNETFITNQNLKKRYIRFMRRNFFTFIFFLVKHMITYSDRHAQKDRNSRFDTFLNKK